MCLCVREEAGGGGGGLTGHLLRCTAVVAASSVPGLSQSADSACTRLEWRIVIIWLTWFGVNSQSMTVGKHQTLFFMLF